MTFCNVAKDREGLLHVLECLGVDDTDTKASKMSPTSVRIATLLEKSPLTLTAINSLYTQYASTSQRMEVSCMRNQTSSSTQSALQWSEL